MFSKRDWDGIEFGLVDGTTDTEGRTITLYFDGIAAICTYHPCSSMDGTRPDKDTARQAYDLAYAAHFKNVQLKCGTDGVFSTGDCNVAPTEQHVTRGQSPWRTPASTKKFERRAYAHLLDVAHLKNAADGTPFQYATTWSSKGETSLAMSIDHTLVPKDDLRVCVYNFEITKRKHNSDHYGQLFTICTRDAMIATLAPSFAPLPGRSKHCVFHLCEAHNSIVLLVPSTQCCTNGCSTVTARCTSPICFSLAHEDYAGRGRERPGEGHVRRLGLCPGPKWHYPAKHTIPTAPPTASSMTKEMRILLQLRISELREQSAGRTEVNALRQQNRRVYHTCSHGTSSVFTTSSYFNFSVIFCDIFWIFRIIFSTSSDGCCQNLGTRSIN